MKKRVLSGIRANGRLHLGHYLGVIKGDLALQEDPEYEKFYMVADLHSINIPYDPKTFQKEVYEVVLDYLGAGLDPQKSTIFIQSQVPEHIELSYLFSTVVSVARMSHLPTYKEKIASYPQNVNMALLYYPVLMAADILIYKASFVPVGVDQEPHLEVAREIARKMNETYGTDFPEPQRFKTEGEYIPSLKGEGKMSKSVEGSYINLSDDLETIKKRLAAAPTDSGKGSAVPKEGPITNLLTFVGLFQGQEKRREYEKDYTSIGVRYAELKAELAEAIYKELKPIQERRKIYENDPALVEKILREGGEKARKVATETVREVKEKMGLS